MTTLQEALRKAALISDAAAKKVEHAKKKQEQKAVANVVKKHTDRNGILQLDTDDDYEEAIKQRTE